MTWSTISSRWRRPRCPTRQTANLARKRKILLLLQRRRPSSASSMTNVHTLTLAREVSHIGRPLPLPRTNGVAMPPREFLQDCRVWLLHAARGLLPGCCMLPVSLFTCDASLLARLLRPCRMVGFLAHLHALTHLRHGVFHVTALGSWSVSRRGCMLWQRGCALWQRGETAR